MLIAPRKSWCMLKFTFLVVRYSQLCLHLWGTYNQASAWLSSPYMSHIWASSYCVCALSSSHWNSNLYWAPTSIEFQPILSSNYYWAYSSCLVNGLHGVWYVFQGWDFGTLGNTLSGCITQYPRVGPSEACAIHSTDSDRLVAHVFCLHCSLVS